MKTLEETEEARVRQTARQFGYGVRRKANGRFSIYSADPLTGRVCYRIQDNMTWAAVVTYFSGRPFVA